MHHAKLALSAAFAVAPDRFCIANFEGDAEDPRSMVLSYDGRFPQPWTRTDIPRRIVGIEAIGENETGTIYAAASDEGDIFIIDGSSDSTQKIPGAGVYSEDAIYGNLHGLTQQDGTLWAYGYDGQVQRQDGNWRRVIARYEEFDISEIRSGHFGTDRTGWFCGSVAPPLISKDYVPDPELDRQIDEAEDEEAYLRLMEELGRRMRGDRASGPSPLMLQYQSGRLSRIAVEAPQTGIVLDVCIESPNRVWAVGSEGMILHGNADMGFRPVTYAGTVAANLYSIVHFRDHFIIAGDMGLFSFDGHTTTQIKPKLNTPNINRNTPGPLKLQSLGDIIMYFDYKHGVCRWDGNVWDWVDIPEGLLARDFKGLD